MKTIRNLTPHSIVVKTGEYTDETGRLIPLHTIFPVSTNILPRVGTKEEYIGSLQIREEGEEGFVPVFSRKMGTVEGLPPKEEGTIYIVSSMILDASDTSRDDLIAPDTGKTCIRDENGNVVAVTRFIGKGS